MHTERSLLPNPISLTLESLTHQLVGSRTVIQHSRKHWALAAWPYACVTVGTQLRRPNCLCRAGLQAEATACDVDKAGRTGFEAGAIAITRGAGGSDGG